MPSPACEEHVTKAIVDSIDEAEVLEIAKKAVFENEDWGDRAKFETSMEGTEWIVRVTRLPVQLGGHRTILIDQSGKVVAYHGGM
jgi:hypothetical protein